MFRIKQLHITPLLTVQRSYEGPLHCHSNISTNCRHSVVVHSCGVQSLPQYHTDSVPCCTSLSGLSRVWQVHVGWVSPILDCTVSRASEPRQKCAVNPCITGQAQIYHFPSQKVVGCACMKNGSCFFLLTRKKMQLNEILSKTHLG